MTFSHGLTTLFDVLVADNGVGLDEGLFLRLDLFWRRCRIFLRPGGKRQLVGLCPLEEVFVHPRASGFLPR